MQFAERMASSHDPIDKRFLQMYMISKAQDQNKTYGFRNTLILKTGGKNSVILRNLPKSKVQPFDDDICSDRDSSRNL